MEASSPRRCMRSPREGTWLSQSETRALMGRMRKLVLSLAACFALAGGTTAKTPPPAQHRVLVELFTSQG